MLFSGALTLPLGLGVWLFQLTEFCPPPCKKSRPQVIETVHPAPMASEMFFWNNDRNPLILGHFGLQWLRWEFYALHPCSSGWAGLAFHSSQLLTFLLSPL
eukprot:EG_transcript_63900